MILIQILAFWIKERRNQCSHNLHLLRSNISTNFYNYWIYFNRAGTYLHGQSKFIYFHILVSLLNMDINMCQGRVKLKSLSVFKSISINLSVSLKPRFLFSSSGQLIIFNQYCEDITKYLTICSLKMFLSYSILPYF